MTISRLTLSNFRNYASVRLEAAAPFVLLTGPNGAGKTNLIEAISLLGPGRGLRGAEYREVARQGGPTSFAVAAEVNGVTLGTEWVADGDGGSRRAVVDHKPAKGPGAFARHIRLLWLTPAMDGLFTGTPGERRRFLDRLTVSLDPAHNEHVNAFEKAMRERNRLLCEPRPDPLWLSAIEATMAETAAAMAAARRAAIELLEREIAKRPRDGVFPWAEIAVQGRLEAALARMPAVRAEDEYRILLAEQRRADAAAGRTLEGPHRSDFSVVHGPKSMAAALCSTGEQKALLTGIILAQAGAVCEAEGMAPILLLDEIAAHMDRARRQGLYAQLERLGCQCWMTGTEPALFGDLPENTLHFAVADAALTRIA